MDAAFEKIDALLVRIGRQGLQRMTRSSADELRALGQTAHNAGLVFIERELETLVTLVGRYLDRDPLFRIGRYMDVVNRIWLLNRQARRRRRAGQMPDQMLDVIGEARRSYQPVEETLFLQAIGASGWVTDTDFVGVTVYFYAQGHEQIHSVAAARPCRYFGRDPQRLLHQAPASHLEHSIWSLSHGAFAFSNAKRSADGRLSLHGDLEVSEAPWMGARAYAKLAARHWRELLDRLRAGQLHPVRGRESVLAYIEPVGFGRLVIDDKAARAHCPLRDEGGAELRLEVPLRAENNLLVDNLEVLLRRQPGTSEPNGPGQAGPEASRPAEPPESPAPPLPDGLFGRVWVSERTLAFSPYTAIFHRPLRLSQHQTRPFHEVHLSLEPLVGATPVSPTEDGGAAPRGW